MRCGTPGYVAPEILNDEGYDAKADMFSAGVILYMMVTGKSVFQASNGREVIKKNTECEISYPPADWGQLSPELKKLTMQLLERDPKNRLSAKQALEHKWFEIEFNEQESLLSEVYDEE